MATSFQKRKLRFTIQLANGTFDKEGNPDTIIIDESFRSHVEIQSVGGYMFSSCRATIFGLSKMAMERLTFIRLLSLDFRRNTLRVEASDDNGQFSVVFLGEILDSAPFYDNAPSVPLVIAARSGVIGSLRPENPDMYPGPQKVSILFDRIAKSLGLRLENNGVESIITDMVLSGSATEKLRTLQEATGVEVYTLFQDGILAICPPGQSRTSSAVEISPATGLVGWPTRRSNGVTFRALFNPSARHGCKIKIESSIEICNGEWYISSMQHALSCNEPGGPWFTDFLATPQGLYINNR